MLQECPGFAGDWTGGLSGWARLSVLKDRPGLRPERMLAGGPFSVCCSDEGPEMSSRPGLARVWFPGPIELACLSDSEWLLRSVGSLERALRRLVQVGAQCSCAPVGASRRPLPCPSQSSPSGHVKLFGCMFGVCVDVLLSSVNKN
jgi:hypothetical protein